MHMVKHVLVLLFVVSMGCGHENAATQQVRSAAVVDLSCDESAIELLENTPMEKRATGCGRSLTYMYKCNPTAGGGQDCRWKAVPDTSGE